MTRGELRPVGDTAGGPGELASPERRADGVPDPRDRGDAPARRDDVGADASLVEARAVLRAAGVSARGVRRAGAPGDVLAVDADTRELDRLRGAVPDLRRIGFRFVALEIGLDGPDARSHVRPGPG